MNPDDMDDKLLLLLHLYGERDDPAELEALLDDDALRAEYRQHSAVKAALEAHQRQRSEVRTPDAAIIAKVLAAAAAPAMRRVDTARPRRKKMRLMAGWGALALAAAVAGILIWPAGFEEGAAPPEALEMAMPATELPAWDDAAQLVDVSNRIRVLDARSTVESWDEPRLLRLDSLPAPGSSQGFTPATVSH